MDKNLVDIQAPEVTPDHMSECPFSHRQLTASEAAPLVTVLERLEASLRPDKAAATELVLQLSGCSSGTSSPLVNAVEDIAGLFYTHIDHAATLSFLEGQRLGFRLACEFMSKLAGGTGTPEHAHNLLLLIGAQTDDAVANLLIEQLVTKTSATRVAAKGGDAA